MCGIVAVISKKQYGFVLKDITAFEQLLYADALRGDDATGVIGVDKDGSFNIDKAAIDARDFLIEYKKGTHSAEALRTGVALIGHNRKATMGSYSDTSAHPFVANGRTAMVHNGTLYNHKALYNTDVDSEALTKHIDDIIHTEGPLVEAMSEGLSHVNGAFACVWYDQVNDKVQAIRNKERPLWYAETPDTYFLCSEGSLLHWILQRNSITYSKLEPLPEFTLLTFKPGNATISMEPVTEKKSPPVSTSTAGTGNTGNTSTQTGVTELSKNNFKRLNKRFGSREIMFWVNDYVERDLFDHSADVTAFTIIGESDSFPTVDHIISGPIDIVELGIKSKAEICDYLYTGTIAEMVFNKKEKHVKVRVKDIKCVPFVPNMSVKLNNEEVPVTIQ